MDPIVELVKLAFYGLAIGLALVGSFMAGFFACYRIRFWEKRAVATEDYDRARALRAAEMERKVLESLDRETDEPAGSDASPMGPPPIMPGVVKRQKIIRRMRNALMGGE